MCPPLSSPGRLWAQLAGVCPLTPGQGLVMDRHSLQQPRRGLLLARQNLPPQLWQLAAPSRLTLLQQLLLQRMDALASARHLRAQVLCALEREPPGRHYQMPSRLTGEAAAPTGGALLSCIWCCGMWSCCG